ncbi:hypothetical protein BDR06DRAFT_586135 [Suillus hirtellus]|nr:hypothetical protein BDR06DRAFT_586135 [Suillus hirtellus]
MICTRDRRSFEFAFVIVMTVLATPSGVQTLVLQQCATLEVQLIGYRVASSQESRMSLHELCFTSSIFIVRNFQSVTR